MRLLTIFLSLMLASAAVAQAPAPAPAGTGGDADLKFESKEKLSDKDKVQRSSGMVGKMRETLKAVLQKLTEARESKDVVKLNCVNEKLTQVKGFIKIGETADLALQEAVAKGDSGAADHEYTKVDIAAQRVAQLRADAEACIGQQAYGGSNADTHVDVVEPADLPTATATAAPPTSTVINPPPPASQGSGE